MKNKKGFTMAELLIVVAIIAVLTSISIVVFVNQLEKSREATDFANVRSAYAALMQTVMGGNSQTLTNITKDNGDYSIEVGPLTQKQQGWQTDVSEMQLAGVKSTEWVGEPEPEGTCTITYTKAGLTIFEWSGASGKTSYTKLVKSLTPTWYVAAKKTVKYTYTGTGVKPAGMSDADYNAFVADLKQKLGITGDFYFDFNVGSNRIRYIEGSVNYVPDANGRMELPVDTVVTIVDFDKDGNVIKISKNTVTKKNAVTLGKLSSGGYAIWDNTKNYEVIYEPGE